MNQLTSVRRLINAAGNSMAGLGAAWRDETAFKQEVIALAFGVPIGIWLADGSPWLFAALICSILLVMVVELLNSGVEAAIDRIGLERHELSGKAKDCASAAVLIACCIALLIWSTAIWQRFT